MFLRYRRTRQPDPGSMALAFQMPVTNQVFQVQGPGIAVAWDWRPTQPTQQYYNHAAPMSGIPTIAGQIFGQPLLNPTGY